MLRTERHLGEEVVNDVVVRDVMEEEAAHPSQEISVDRSSSTALEVPLFAAVVGHVRVGVVQVGDHDDCPRTGVSHDVRSKGG